MNPNNNKEEDIFDILNKHLGTYIGWLGPMCDFSKNNPLEKKVPGKKKIILIDLCSKCDCYIQTTF